MIALCKNKKKYYTFYFCGSFLSLKSICNMRWWSFKPVPLTRTVMSPDSCTDVKWWERRALLPFQSPCSILLSGATQAGKTRFTYRLLENAHGMFEKRPKTIIYAYGEYQQLFEQMESRIPGLILHHGLPTKEQITEWTNPEQHTIIVLDDLMTQVTRSEDVLFLFTVTAHHRCCSVIFLTQNLFMPGKYARSISLNCHYVIMFRNFRDNRSVVSGFGAQAYPGKTKYFKDAYEKATSQPYGYLVSDMTVTCPNEYRLRTKIFPNEDTHVFVPQ